MTQNFHARQPMPVSMPVRRLSRGKSDRGFALVVAVSMLVLLSLMAVAMLSLSSLSLSNSSIVKAEEQARSNARMALMIAIGELQREMGPDMRISSESAVFDRTPQTEAIDGVSQSHWLASYESWGDWLTSNYSLPTDGTTLDIQDTYVAQRAPMFRRWLLSLPPEMSRDVTLPLSALDWDNDESVIMVGEGTLGRANAQANPHQVTRAHLMSAGDRGNYAWWIGPENQKACIQRAHRPRGLSPDEWEVAHGDTAEVGVGTISGLEVVDGDPALSPRLMSLKTLEVAGVDTQVVGSRFYDLTACSKGVVTSVRSGHLKKDLSLLFEQDAASLPSPYRYDRTTRREPSIRPMSPDLLARGPQIPERHFQSWTNMRHFYRMYRQDPDPVRRGIENAHSLEWDGSQPYATGQAPILYRDRNNDNQWLGDDSYHRLPVLAKITFIYSLMARKFSTNPNDYRYRHYVVYTPVYTYWNPYNVEMRIPDNRLGCLSSTYQVLPMHMQTFNGNRADRSGSASDPNYDPIGILTGNAHSFLRSEDGGDIIFKPGEFRVFSHRIMKNMGSGQSDPLSLYPGFDPMAYGGDQRGGGGSRWIKDRRNNPGFALYFGHSIWGGNVGYGNTAGSLCHTPFWVPDSGFATQGLTRAYNWNYPVMYQNDWFNLAQTYTPVGNDPLINSGSGIAARPENIMRWVYTDDEPVPVAFTQLVIKGLSEFEHESINWAEDWRCRNWIQSPPFYFGYNMHISEDDGIAHTQRVDNAFVMNFGPMSAAEMPKVVAHVGERAFLGSGANPFEKITAAPVMELPSAPVGGIAGFSGMRINPGFVDPRLANSRLRLNSTGGYVRPERSFYYGLAKTMAYQSGVTGPGIGNSFIHPMIPRDDIYQYFNNSVSSDPDNRGNPLGPITYNDSRMYSDYWDHVFLLNDALWDDYFVSSLADQNRPGAGNALGLNNNIQRLVNQGELANTRFLYQSGGKDAADVIDALEDADGYLKAARHLMVDGMFNVNSTSVDAWFALFTGIRERQLYYRDRNGALQPVTVPSDKRIAISRHNTPTMDEESLDPEYGTVRGDGNQTWSGVRFLDDEQLRLLAEKCVEQVKRRGPFLNFSEFVNRRLSNDDLGLMGALQSAIDFDNASPDSRSINYTFKNGPDFMMSESDLGNHEFQTPEAVNGSRFAGIPGYVIQSDLLKPIANTLSVRDDTFRIRAYGETRDNNGRVIARAWCEAIVQRNVEYIDSTNDPTTPARIIQADGSFADNPALSPLNRKMGRKLQIESFRWLTPDEI